MTVDPEAKEVETSETAPEPEVVHTPPADDHSDVRTMVTELRDTVAQLADQVAALTPAETDTSPIKGPWYARKIL